MFQMPNVMPDQADTYKCFATNEYGVASVIVVLNVIEGKDILLVLDDILMCLILCRNTDGIQTQAFSQIYFKY